MSVKQSQNQLNRENVLTSNLYLRFGILELQVLSPVIKKLLFQTFNIFLAVVYTVCSLNKIWEYLS